MAGFGVLFGIVLVTFGSSLVIVFCVAPAVPNPHARPPYLLIWGTFLESVSEVGSRPPLLVCLMTFGVPLGGRFGPLWVLLRSSFFG